MTYRFVPVEQDTSPLNATIMLGGGSGTGKTYSALLLADGLAGGEPYAVIDTENRRALHHRRSFPRMHHLDLQPDPDRGFSPEVYAAAIDAAEAAGYPVIVIDSFSHFWEGIGGILELQARALDRMTRGDASKRDQLSMLAWAEVKPRARRLVDRIIRAKSHVILCVRAKKMIVDPRTKRNIRENKIRREDLPWDLAIDKDIIFETTQTHLLTPERPGVPVPIKFADEFKPLLPPGEPITAEAGARIAEWAAGKVSDDKEFYDRAREAARGGRGSAEAFWNKLSKGERARLRPIRDELSRIVADAEAMHEDSNPFEQHDQPEEGGDGSADGEADAPPHNPEEEKAAYERWRREQEGIGA